MDLKTWTRYFFEDLFIHISMHMVIVIKQEIDTIIYWPSMNQNRYIVYSFCIIKWILKNNWDILILIFWYRYQKNSFEFFDTIIWEYVSESKIEIKNPISKAMLNINHTIIKDIHHCYIALEICIEWNWRDMKT